jgi:hypothetical protein
VESAPCGVESTPCGVKVAINTKKPVKRIFRQCFAVNKPHFRRILL